MLRCVIYCGDLTLWFALGLTGTLAVVNPQDAMEIVGHPLTSFFLAGRAHLYGRPLLILVGAGILAMMVLNGMRLWVAYRAYLRFKSARMLIVASQLVVLLAILAALSWTSEHLG